LVTTVNPAKTAKLRGLLIMVGRKRGKGEGRGLLMWGTEAEEGKKGRKNRGREFPPPKSR